MEFYLARDNNQAGPFSKEQVSEMIRSGGIEKTDMLWYEGIPTWKCLGMASEFSDDFKVAEAAPKAAAAAPDQEKTSDASKPESSSGSSAAPGESGPIPYNPNGVPAPDESSFKDLGIKKETVLAARRVRLGAAMLDGVVMAAFIWLISAALLPSGLSLMDFVSQGRSHGGYQVDKEALRQELESYGNDITQEQFAQVLGQYANPANDAAALSIADRFSRGELTEAEEKKIIVFGLSSLGIVLAIGIVQLVLLSTRGQTIGKILLGIKIVRDQSQDTAKFVHAFLLRSFVPWLIQAIPLIGGLFALVDSLFIFSSDKKCLHDRIASTSVVKV